MRLRRVLDILCLAAMVVLLAASLQSNLLFNAVSHARWDPQNIANDPVSTWEKRTSILREILPGQGKVGYLAEWDIPGAEAGSADQDNEYRLVQYVLAPLIVQRGADHDLIVGNFGGTEYPIEELFGVKILANYGYGIYLLKGPGK
jgi:hypothetical protein